MAGMVPDVPMEAITVRMGKEARATIGAAADREGTSISQYMREAALARAWFTHGFLQDDDAQVARVLLAIGRAADAAGAAGEPLDVYVKRLLDA